MRDSLRHRIRTLPLPIQTERLALVLPSARYVNEVVREISDPLIARVTMTIPYPYRRRDALAHVRHARRRYLAGAGLSLYVVRRSDGVLVGGVGLHELNERHARGEVGYWLGRRHRGQGYATEAVRGLLNVCFHHLRLHRIEAGVFPGNENSVRVLRRCGFRYEGTMRDLLRKAGVHRSSMVFSLLSSDRPRRRNARRRGRVVLTRPARR